MDELHHRVEHEQGGYHMMQMVGGRAQVEAYHVSAIAFAVFDARIHARDPQGRIRAQNAYGEDEDMVEDAHGGKPMRGA